ncbi:MULTISPECIES: hypothetical protein [Cobetia]|jgi:hypothetical protein|uniref:hypothetical protein n=1 Tax=Cobetia TaxID=204286 RepID=UPI001C0825AC|nr:hypothetical protein [Cobetia amphilecti]MBU3008782.1 hypothetical protein [Cobetia amphilecti]
MDIDEKIVKAILAEIIDDVHAGYKHKLLEEIEVNEPNDLYSRAKLSMKSLTVEQKKDILDFIRMAMIDASSVIFGTIDGSHFPKGIHGDFMLKYEDCEVQGSLQDILISESEDLNVYK